MIYIIVILVGLYLLPTWIAMGRGLNGGKIFGIFMLNLWLSWSGVVWIIALIWAINARRI